MNADELLKLATLPVEKITVPSWGEVSIRGLTVPEYDRFEAESAKNGMMPHNGWLLRYGVIEEDGKHKFDDSHVEKLNAIPAVIGNPLTRAILRLCGIGGEVKKKSPAAAESGQ